MSRRTEKKGQLFALDALFAMVVFSFLIGTFLLFNSTVPSTIGILESRAALQEDAQTALLSLVAAPGEPSNWTLYNMSLPEGSQVRAVGLASSPWVLDPGKVSALSAANATNYAALKGMLGISKPGYNFYFYLSLANGTDVPVAGLARPAANLTSTISSQFVSSEGSSALASLMIWLGAYE